MTNLILVSGSYSTGAAWRPILDHLPKGWTTTTVTLPGYAGVPDPRTRDNCAVELLADCVLEAARDLTGPIHVAAHSFGFQAVVAAIKTGALTPASLTSFEGNTMYPLVATGQTALMEDIHRVRDEFVAAHDSGDEDAAGIIIDYWGNPGSWKSMPDAVKGFARAGAGTNALDWIGAVDFTFDIAGLAATVPEIGLVRGEYANAAMIGICDALYDLIPQATLEIIGGANHFLITTHPWECAHAILEMVERG